MRNKGDTISHGEMFRRGFYGGLGLWFSFVSVNVMILIGGLLLMLSLGVVGTAVDAWWPAKKHPTPIVAPAPGPRSPPPVSAPVTHRSISPSR